jgi:hypothetical protein
METMVGLSKPGKDYEPPAYISPEPNKGEEKCVPPSEPKTTQWSGQAPGAKGSSEGIFDSSILHRLGVSGHRLAIH